MERHKCRNFGFLKASCDGKCGEYEACLRAFMESEIKASEHARES